LIKKDTVHLVQAYHISKNNHLKGKQKQNKKMTSTLEREQKGDKETSNTVCRRTRQIRGKRGNEYKEKLVLNRPRSNQFDQESNIIFSFILVSFCE